MGGFSSLNPTKDFRGSVISRLHIFQRKPFIRNRAVFPFFVDCEKIFSLFQYPPIYPFMIVFNLYQFVKWKNTMPFFHPLTSIRVRSYRYAFFLLKPSFTILLETVLLYSLKLPILFSTIEFHNTPYHFTSSPLLS